MEPVVVKEFKNRWYVIARDTTDNFIKHFGFDRISQLEITKTRLPGPIEFNADDFFQYSFGITTLSGKEPERIELSFNKLQGAYIKAVPLHQYTRSISRQ
ncbi:MAG: hypothetical protein DHS20C17_20160 [Cyclobacteriaceae bacterium]|nr:MAG: hypothetical protein DHS20C17_20160 [Cyclobacteriaceae bacterium]